MKRITQEKSFSRVGSFLIRWGGLITSVVLIGILISMVVADSRKQEVIMVDYLVTTRDIAPLETISSKDVAIYSFPENAKPPTGITTDQAKSIFGQRALITIRKGELLSPSFFGVQEVGNGNNIASALPEGKRLVYFHSADFHAVPPDLQKQNHIDIYAVPQNKDVGTKAVKIITSVEVFDMYRSKNDEGSMLGLLVDDTQADSVSTYLNSDWKLQIVLKPAKEEASPVKSLTNEPEQATPEAETEE